ncbi:MAG: NAD(P)/FAD-dependent oxidoreductase [Cuniculiplasma sp.]
MNKDFDFDTIIVGAGTGGLSAAATMKNSDSKYIVLDRKEEVGLPVRSTGAVSLEWVKKIGMPTDPRIIASEIYNMSFRTEKGKRIDLTFDHPVGMVYNFTKYERYLSEKFAGTLKIKMKTRVLSTHENVVQTDSEELTARNIILAAGPQSNLGNKLGKNEALVAYEETRSLDERQDFQMILWFSNLAPGGYFWDFADSKGTRKIGVCYYPVNGETPKKILDKFTSKFPELQGDIVHTMAHQIPLTKPATSVISGNRYFVGDMVNAVLNTTAGGLQGAFWSGKEAAKAALENNPEKYQRVWTEQIRPWLQKHNDLHKKIHAHGEKTVGRYITLAKVMPKSMKMKVFGGL